MRPKSLTLVSLLAALATVALSAFGTACKKTTDAERHESAKATAVAEDMAQEGSLTSAQLDTGASAQAARGTSEEATRANVAANVAFQLEQSDYRRRLQRALDLLDREITRTGAVARQGEGRLRELGTRRELLRKDLDAVDRSTDQDWATLRTKVERDLDLGRPGTQVLPGTERPPGEAQ